MSLWDANWETSQGVGKLTERAFNQIRSACQERTLGAGRTMPGLIVSDIPEGGRVRKTHRTALHNEVSALIPLYVNHLLPTATPGNYNGETTIPTFTEATALAAVGDSIRLPIPNDHLNAAAWNFQTKKILNLLRWAKENIFVGGHYYGKNGSSPDWNTAVSAINAAAWTTDGIKPRHYNFYSPNQGENYEIIRNKYEKTITNSSGFNSIIDAYCLFGRAYDDIGDQEIFYSADYPDAIYNKLSKTESLTINNSASADLKIGDFTNNTTLQPNGTTILSYSWAISDGIIVKKFDAPGGFGYLD